MIISILSTLLMILLFFFSGKILESIRRLLIMLLDLFFRLLNLFGINLNKKEKQIKLSEDFKTTFKDIKTMKKSKQNIKMKPSVNKLALIIFIVSISLVFFNLQIISGNAISLWLFNHNLFPFWIVTQQNMDITYTAVSFSLLSFSASTLLKQWKDTKDFRDAKKRIKQKSELMKLMTSKEMLDLSREKDDTKLKEVLLPQEDKEENV